MKQRHPPESHFKVDGTGCNLKKCPLEPVHNKLRESHRQWHDALRHYSSPGAFADYLNACIQSLRNVTFVLQKNKSLFLGFDEWYDPWQTHMRQDVIMRWLVDARNRITKEGDLQTNSVASAFVVNYYERHQINDLIVPVTWSNRRIVNHVIDTYRIPPLVRRDGCVTVNRRWIVDELKDHEVLAALAHGYCELSALLSSAHRPDVIAAASTSKRTPLPCMRCQEFNSVTIKIATGEEVTLRQRPFRPTPVLEQDARQRYGAPPDFGIPVSPSESTFEQTCDYFFRLARTVFEKDGNHHTMILLFLPGGQTRHIGVEFADNTDKYYVWDRIAEDVKKSKAWGLITIGECWTSIFDPLHPGRTATEDPLRGEALTLEGATESGKRVSLHANIYRSATDGVFLGKTSEIDRPTAVYMNPIYRVWAQQAGSGDV